VRRERIINQITTHIQQSVDVESILTTAVLELGKALELQEAAVRIGTEAELLGSSPGKNGGIT
ncbi:MAG: hypothetical protein ACE5GO_10395, partial [Anaerolineales bacterium]